jgi:integration host factor subunit beta
LGRAGWPWDSIAIITENTPMNDATMTKADLVEEVAKVTDLPRKESEVVVETIFEHIIRALQTGDKIEIRGFGSFRTRQRQGRIGRNPKTGARVEVPPKRIPFFKPSKELKDFVNTSGASAATPHADPASS